MKIGKLEEVDVRDLWKHEQYDFSEWLSKEENMEQLSDVIGLTLVNVDKEVYVGSYRCDLVAEDETTGTKVIIENQLESTNHDHLGKIITYASGLNASVIVWIVKTAREEHRSAIEWLNNNTMKNISFFLIEIHAFKIGDSLPAPKFEIIEKPNDFIKLTKGNNNEGEISKTESERLEFWNLFNDVVVERGKPFNIRKATTDHWRDVAIGTAEAHIAVSLIKKYKYIIVELNIIDNKQLFDKLLDLKEEIETELGYELDWLRLDNRKASRILYYIPGLNFDDHSNYPELMNAAIDKVIEMRKVFKKYLDSK